MSAPYIPSGEPFHVESDGYRVWQTESGGFVVSHPKEALTYRSSTLEGVAGFITRQRKSGKRVFK